MIVPQEVIEKIKSLTRPAIIAISGFGGAGKTTTAELLSKEFDAPVVGVDQFSKDKTRTDFTHWSSVDFERLANEVLVPFHNGQQISYGHYDWGANTVVKTVNVLHNGLLIVEGVGLFRPETNKYFDFKIWVDVSQDEAIARGKKQDREVHKNPQDERWDGIWKRYDDEYMRDFKPTEVADVILTNI